MYAHCENRFLMQSLALMRSAITYIHYTHTYTHVYMMLKCSLKEKKNCFVLSFRTKTKLLERAMDMRTRVKLILHFISIMKVHNILHTVVVAPFSAHHMYIN